MSTGYSPIRAQPHEALVRRVVEELRRRGYNVQLLPSYGHRPDLLVSPCARHPDGAYIEVKVQTEHPNLAIEIDSLRACRALEAERRVFIVHAKPDAHPSRWLVDTPDSLLARFLAGPNPSTPNGSNDPWYLFGPGGIQFDGIFPPRTK
jgi:hypothetical protein